MANATKPSARGSQFFLIDKNIPYADDMFRSRTQRKVRTYRHRKALPELTMIQRCLRWALAAPRLLHGAFWSILIGLVKVVSDVTFLSFFSHAMLIF